MGIQASRLKSWFWFQKQQPVDILTEGRRYSFASGE